MLINFCAPVGQVRTLSEFPFQQQCQHDSPTRIRSGISSVRLAVSSIIVLFLNQDQLDNDDFYCCQIILPFAQCHPSFGQITVQPCIFATASLRLFLVPGEFCFMQMPLQMIHITQLSFAHCHSCLLLPFICAIILSIQSFITFFCDTICHSISNRKMSNCQVIVKSCQSPHGQNFSFCQPGFLQ